MKILALDIATKTGWCSPTDSGVWDFKPKRGESEGMRCIRFRTAVIRVLTNEPIDVIAYERAAGFHKGALIVESEMIGVLKTIALDEGVELCCKSATEIKKFATGKGNAKKLDMIESCINRYEVTPIDDNHADAIHLWNMVNKEINT